MSRRWRLFLIFAFFVFILLQTWFLITPSVPKAAAKMSLNQTKATDTDQQPLPLTRTRPKKQSTLNGFGGFTSDLPPIQHAFSPEPADYTKLREKRRLAIKKSFLHGWNGYKKYAFGHDELSPLSNKPKDPFGGWGATLVDSLSTLLVMELESEFQTAMHRIHRISFKVNDDISVFESIIRYLGGLLSAYDLTDKKYRPLMAQAEKLAIALLPAFNTPSGLPTHHWNTAKNQSTWKDTLIADAASVQLELMMLSQFTQNPIYGQKAQIITDLLDNMGYEHGLYIKGLYPSQLDVKKGRFKDNTVTFGAMGDSAFEYFLKQYLLTDGKISQYERMYKDSIRSMKQLMLRQVPGYDMLMLPPFDTQHETSENGMDHLTCFVPGMLAMGAKTFNEPEDLMIAKGLLETCVFMYRTSTTGLGPETWSIDKTQKYNPLTFNKTKKELRKSRDWWYGNDERQVRVQKPNEEEVTQYKAKYKLPEVKPRPQSLYFGNENYLLRPETLESLFILYRVTGDQKYQEYGWEIFQAIEKWCKTKSGFAAVQNVDREDIRGKEDNQIDSMESFLFAETFKYLYLLFSPSDILSLDKFVFSTEAHPFQRRHWNWEKIKTE